MPADTSALRHGCAGQSAVTVDKAITQRSEARPLLGLMGTVETGPSEYLRGTLAKLRWVDGSMASIDAMRLRRATAAEVRTRTESQQNAISPCVCANALLMLTLQAQHVEMAERRVEMARRAARQEKEKLAAEARQEKAKLAARRRQEVAECAAMSMEDPRCSQYVGEYQRNGRGPVLLVRKDRVSGKYTLDTEACAGDRWGEPLDRRHALIPLCMASTASRLTSAATHPPDARAAIRAPMYPRSSDGEDLVGVELVSHF